MDAYSSTTRRRTVEVDAGCPPRRPLSSNDHMSLGAVRGARSDPVSLPALAFVPFLAAASCTVWTPMLFGSFFAAALVALITVGFVVSGSQTFGILAGIFFNTRHIMIIDNYTKMLCPNVLIRFAADTFANTTIFFVVFANVSAANLIPCCLTQC